MPARPISNTSRYMAVCLVLALSTLAVYWPVGGHEFVVFDDRTYVTENPVVWAGLSWEGIKWAFSGTHAHNWHPLTWLSHMLDVDFYGLNPKGHHYSNVIIHILNTALLFVLLHRMTRSLWRSAFVAGFFALHPLHVESVAWVAERKDVLSTFFWMLTMCSYVLYVEGVRPGRVWMYGLTLVCLVLGLMAKPMLVTLPFVLLLLDYWPLKRAGIQKDGKKELVSLLLEKLPFLVLAAVSSAVTVYAQQHVLKSYESYPFGARVANGLVSYGGYLWKTLWPAKLAIFYPHVGGTVASWKWMLAGCLLVAVTALVSRFARPHLMVGWLWFLGTLVPVIGLVQVGLQGMADRYSYVPLVGLFIMVVWGIHDVWARRGYGQVSLGILGGLALLACATVTQRQLGHWKNSQSLFRHATEVTTDNDWAHYNLGLVLLHEGKLDEALEHTQESLRIQPINPDALVNVGTIYARKGDLNQAIAYFEKATTVDREHGKAHFNLGLAFLKQGRTGEAIFHFTESVRIAPENAEAHYLLGLQWQKGGDPAEAVKCFSEALRLNPGYDEARDALSIAGTLSVRESDASETYLRMGMLYFGKSKPDDALRYYEKALSLRPRLAGALEGVALVHLAKKEYGQALSTFRKALDVEPGRPELYYNIACMYSRLDRAEDGVLWLGKALEMGYDNWELIKGDQDLKNVRGVPGYKELLQRYIPE